MAKLICFCVSISLLLASTSHVIASVQPPEHFASWLRAFEQEAITKGISSETTNATLETAFLDEHVILLDQRQPESVLSFNNYIQRIVTPERIRDGRVLRQKYADLLGPISKQYGVAPELIVALWGIESSYGRNKGNYNIVDSLMTLAFQGRRPDYFRNELFNALRIIDEEHIPASSLRGSWAGAMGQCQFMPSTFLLYAVDYNHTGTRDIWNQKTDVFASIARYIAAEGWEEDKSWGQEVSLKNAIVLNKIGLNQSYTLKTWHDLGVRLMNGVPLDELPLQASLIQPDGVDGQSFLVYNNFRTLLKWNRSTYFALAVGLLTDRIK